MMMIRVIDSGGNPRAWASLVLPTARSSREGQGRGGLQGKRANNTRLRPRGTAPRKDEGASSWHEGRGTEHPDPV